MKFVATLILSMAQFAVADDYERISEGFRQSTKPQLEALIKKELWGGTVALTKGAGTFEACLGFYPKSERDVVALPAIANYDEPTCVGLPEGEGEKVYVYLRQKYSHFNVSLSDPGPGFRELSFYFFGEHFALRERTTPEGISKFYLKHSCAMDLCSGGGRVWFNGEVIAVAEFYEKAWSE
jgi:hypothetical protein